jgi:hypothetical protein
MLALAAAGTLALAARASGVAAATLWDALDCLTEEEPEEVEAAPPAAETEAPLPQLRQREPSMKRHQLPPAVAAQLAGDSARLGLYDDDDLNRT